MESAYGWISSLWLVWGVILFLAIIAWAFWPSRRKRFERDAKIPFRDERERK